MQNMPRLKQDHANRDNYQPVGEATRFLAKEQAKSDSFY